MTRPVPLIAGILGLLALLLAVVYALVPAGSLPGFIPGFQAGSDHIHTSHALGSFVVAIVLLVVAWFLGRREDYP